MRSLEVLLDDAERSYRHQAWRVYPLRADIAIERSQHKEMSHGAQYWFFATDMKRTYAFINEDEKLQGLFEKDVQQHWQGNPNELAKETLNYLLWHETYHPYESPFSSGTPDADREQIRQAIWRGMMKADPALSGPMQLAKVATMENTIEDLIIDNRLYLDNQSENHFRNDIIPLFDFLELNKEEKPDTNQYTITRYIYGALYGPESTHGFFESKMKKKGVDAAEDVLGAVLEKKVTLPRSDDNGKKHPLEDYAKEIRQVFKSEDRYNAVERVAEALGHFKAQGPGKGGMGQLSQGGLAQLIQDLLAGMTPEQQQQFLQQLGNATEEDKDKAGILLQAGGQLPGMNLPGEMSTIDVYATHEQYKRQKPPFEIYGGSREGVAMDVGNRYYWKFTKSEVLTKDQVGKMNLRDIEKLQRKSRLPWIVQMQNGLYRLNTYSLVEKKVRDVVYVEESFDVPDHTEFYLDVSGSMGSTSHFKIGDDSRLDMLYHVFYGFIDAIDKGGKITRKKPKFRINKFADITASSEPITTSEFLRGNAEALDVLFKANVGGGTQLKIDDKKRFPGKVTYCIVSDGGTNGADTEAEKMIQLSKNNTVVMFEIGGTYDLGRILQRKKGHKVQYAQVHDKKKMLEEGLKVLLSR